MQSAGIPGIRRYTTGSAVSPLIDHPTLWAYVSRLLDQCASFTNEVMNGQARGKWRFK